MSGLVLSLFPGIGLLDMAFESEGFCIVRGPDLLWGGDIRRFHPPAGRFDGVIGGPPCKRWSRFRHIIEANGYELADDLIPDFERCVDEADPSWFVMENVPGAPLPRQATGSALVRDADCGGLTERTRRISWAGVDIMLLLPALRAEGAAQYPAVTGPGRVAMCRGGVKSTLHKLTPSLAEACERQGLPPDFLADAPFTATAKREAVGNGVPLPMGRAIARAVKAALANREAA